MEMSRSTDQQRVLIIDKDPATLYRTTDSLRFQGFAVISASKINDGLDLLATDVFDIVVQQHGKGDDQDGLRVSRLVRKQRVATTVVLLDPHAGPLSELLIEVGAGNSQRKVGLFKTR